MKQKHTWIKSICTLKSVEHLGIFQGNPHKAQFSIKRRRNNKQSATSYSINETKPSATIMFNELPKLGNFHGSFDQKKRHLMYDQETNNLKQFYF
jgi:hypothetical protein